MRESIAKTYATFFKYAIVGSFGTAIDLGSLYLFVDLLHIHLLVSTALSFLLAVINNFILNKFWTFQNKSSNVRKQFIKFLIVSIVGLFLTEICMAFFVYGLTIWYMAAKLITSGLVLVWNFLANKYWTFKDRIFYVAGEEEYDFDVSIIIPAYNEERRIEKTLESINSYFTKRRITTQIIVVDDGSSDNTVGIVKNLKERINGLNVIAYYPNRGKGHAVKKGVDDSRGAVILFVDADNSTRIEEFDKFYPILKDSHVVIGSRYISGSDIVVTQPHYRVLIGRLGNKLIQLFLLDGINDTQCGFKAFRHEAARQIFSRMKVNRFGFDMEILSIARLLNLTIREIPVNWYNSEGSKIRPVKDAFRTFGELIYIKLNLWGGRYN